MRGPPDVRSVNRIATIRGTTGHMLLFAILFGQCLYVRYTLWTTVQYHRTYARVARRPLLCHGVGDKLSL